MKIASTRNGVTAIQADIKTQGLPMKVVTEAMEQSVRSKNQILDIMESCISRGRQIRKDCWPVTKELKINPGQRSQLFGPGGMNIKKIFLETGVHLTETDPNVFNVFAPSPMSLGEAESMLNEFLASNNIPNFEFGAIYEAKIVEMRENGVLVTLYDKMKPTLIHVAQLDSRRVSIDSNFNQTYIKPSYTNQRIPLTLSLYVFHLGCKSRSIRLSSWAKYQS